MAKLICVLASVLGVCSAVCTIKGQRRAWHTFSNTEKLAYIDAEMCLMRKPATIGLPGTKSRFDEFQAMHQLQAYAIHYVAFLPFHRALMHSHETYLRTECGYQGWQPYWQEQLDAGAFSPSSILDPVYGFGGGIIGGNDLLGACITDGPFVNYTNHMGPGYAYTEHYINRRLDDAGSKQSSQEQVDKCLAQTTWINAWNCIEFAPHLGGHYDVGGQMKNGVSSPGDPLFYLHHTWLDKVWADWQDRNRTQRLTEMGGENVMSAFYESVFIPRPANIPRPTGADGDPGNVTTLQHVLNMYGNGPNRTIADVMDIRGDILCYEYVEP